MSFFLIKLELMYKIIDLLFIKLYIESDTKIISRIEKLLKQSLN